MKRHRDGFIGLLLSLLPALLVAGSAGAATFADLKTADARHGKLDGTLSALAQAPGIFASPESRSMALRSAGGRVMRFNSKGEIEVYVHMYRGIAPAEPVLVAMGLNIALIHHQYDILKGWIAPDALESLSQLSFVRRVTVPDYAITRTGSVNSEGDVQLRAHDLRAAGITGTGVRIGVISDGIDSRAAAQATGDLPGAITIQTFAGSGDEGTAMLEIIHDLAPGATLGFCGPADSMEFVTCVQQLDATFNADIIVDDLGFLNEPYFEDGMAALAVQAAATGGVDYVSAAGNSAAGGYYEDDYFAANAIFPGLDPTWESEHDFGMAGIGGADSTQSIVLAPNESACAVLQWNDPFGGSDNDYDLFILDDNLAFPPLSFSIATQTGTQNPLEAVFYENTSGANEIVHIVVARFAGMDRRLKLVVNTGLCKVFGEYFTAAGSIFGHPAVPGALAIASINTFDPGLDTIAPYSSRGPVRIDFPAFVLRPKPDLTGIDCGSVTGAGGFGQLAPDGSIRFCGTSAAAPHVAAVLALLKSTGMYAADEDVDALKNTAVDLAPMGRDDVFGFGRVTAVAAAQQLVLLATIDSPAADITITPGTTVNFQGTCNDDPNAVADPFSFAWNFGDTTTSTAEDPGAKAYPAEGTFTVTFTCTNANGANTATRVITVAAATDGGGDGGGGDSGGGGGGGGCFIATAAYGSYLHPRVQVLRDFRDQYLLTNAPGQAFVQWYYRVSPPLAGVIAEQEGLRLLARGLLTPVVLTVQYPLGSVSVLLLGLLGLRRYRAARARG